MDALDRLGGGGGAAAVVSPPEVRFSGLGDSRLVGSTLGWFDKMTGIDWPGAGSCFGGVVGGGGLPSSLARKARAARRNSMGSR